MITPGPWRFVRETTPGDTTDQGAILGQRDDWEVQVPPWDDPGLVCWFGDDTQYYPTNGAPPNPDNLALILAAPDLLAACKLAVATIDAQDDKMAEGCKEALLAAIAKAEGKEPA